MRFTRRLATLMIGGGAVAGGLTASGITASPAYAGLPYPAWSAARLAT